MSDNVDINSGSGGPSIATDDIAGIQYQRIKLIHGIGGVNDGDVSKTNPLPTNSFPLEFHKTNSSLYTIFGTRNLWTDTSLSDCSAYLGSTVKSNNDCTLGTTYYITSTSTEDTLTGTGVDTVRVVYLDSSGVQQVLISSITGTSPISIGNAISYIQWMEVYHSANYNRYAKGNISISSTNGAAVESSIVEYLLSGTTKSESCRYKIPSDKTGFLIDYTIVASGAPFKYVLHSTTFSESDTVSNSFIPIVTGSIRDGDRISNNLLYYQVPSGAEVKVSAIPSDYTFNNSIYANLRILIR